MSEVGLCFSRVELMQKWVGVIDHKLLEGSFSRRVHHNGVL